MTLPRQERHAILATAAAIVVLAGIAITQYVRTAWPFAETTTGKPAAAVSAHESHAAHGDAPTGYSAVTIEPAQAEAIGLATAPVLQRELTRTVRSVGILALDETRSAHVHAKVRGWIDTIQANFIGQVVRAGQPLCSIYSQEVFAAEAELVGLLDRPADDPLVAAGRRRLALWDVPKGEIERLEKSREPMRTFSLLAPRSGVIIGKSAIQGTYVDPSAELYTISDLTRLWVIVDLYESDAPYVHLGDHAALTIEGHNGPLAATVSFLAPTIDEATRTVKARFAIDNRDGRLRPGAFVSADFTLALGPGLTIPESAVIRTGTRSIVFLVHGTHLQPREITLGPSSGELYRVERGLAIGDQVATGAQFLLDSESRLRATSAPGGGHVH
ncbi:MAG: efflux RND transporter periplasmic adaptor subunit [Kofleriaceae bacterium]